MTKTEQIDALAAQLIAYKTISDISIGNSSVESYLKQLAKKIYNNKYLERYDISTTEACIKSASVIINRRETIKPVISKLARIKGDRVNEIEALTAEQLDLLMEYYNVSMEQFENGVFEQIFAEKK